MVKNAAVAPSDDGNWADWGLHLAQGGCNYLNSVTDLPSRLTNCDGPVLAVAREFETFRLVATYMRNDGNWLERQFGRMAMTGEVIPSWDWSHGLIVDEDPEIHAWSRTAGNISVDLFAAAAMMKFSGWLQNRAPKSVSPQVRSAASKVEGFLGKDMVIKRADGKGFVALSKDGTRRFRLDLKGHGDAPHGHIEIFDAKRQRWIDAGPEHRYYFKGQE
jgi:hypothetical protein